MLWLDRNKLEKKLISQLESDLTVTNYKGAEKVLWPECVLCIGKSSTTS